MSGDNIDFCEYVYNPLMRQYQAMMRLLQIIGNSQAADCNDIECFAPNDPNSPMNALNSAANDGTPSQFMSTYAPLLLVWALFAFALFIFRPSSMRRSSQAQQKSSSTSHNNHGMNGLSSRRSFPRDDDDDNSFAS